MPRWLRENGLSIVLFGLFGVFLVGQGLTGWRTYNAEQREHHEQTVGLEAYLTTGHFVEATFENWESEFLQMACYVLLTVWLVQKGSSESKPLGGEPARPDHSLRRKAPNLGCSRGGAGKAKLWHRRRRTRKCRRTHHWSPRWANPPLRVCPGGSAEPSRNPSPSTPGGLSSRSER